MIELFDHQKEAVEKLRSGNILMGGVGSGKSLTAIAYFLLKECSSDKSFTVVKKPKNLLIITIAKNRDEKKWDRECAVLGLSQDSTKSLAGINVKIDSWHNIKKYLDFKDGFVIFDEQKVVGSGAWVKAFYVLARNNDWILLTATPGDSWLDYIPVFVANGFYKNKTKFIERHGIYDRYSKWPQIKRWVEVKRLEYLRNSIIIKMNFERDTVRNYIYVDVDYDKTNFKRIIKDRWNIYEEYPIESSSEMYALMRRVVNTDISRLHALLNILKKHPKIIVFYCFDYELDILRKIKEIDESVSVSEWNGHKHEPIPETDKWVYLVNYMAGAEGWDCTLTDTTVFYSQQYSYKIFEQSCGRIDRLNTPYKNLNYYILKSKSWIDVMIYRALSQKKDFNERTVQFAF